VGDLTFSFCWFDTLCINQSNDSEKTEQVRMMRDIYKGAHIVRAWIGLEKEQDAAGFALLRIIGERYGHYIDDTATALRIAAQPRRFDTLEELGLPRAENPQWKAMVDILYRDYFFRVWIIQEFLVGPALHDTLWSPIYGSARSLSNWATLRAVCEYPVRIGVEHSSQGIQGRKFYIANDRNWDQPFSGIFCARLVALLRKLSRFVNGLSSE
jgi:hypothetical protein